MLWRHACLSALLVVALLGSHAEAQQTTVSGTFVTIWMDPPPGRGQPTALHMLTDGRGGFTRLEIPEAELQRLGGTRRLHGSLISVTGRSKLAATGTGAVVVADAITVRQPVSAMQYVSPSRPYLTILCRYSDTPIPNPRETYLPIFAGNGPVSLDAYFREVSNGKMNLSGSAVMGWYDLPFPKAYYTPDGFTASPDFGRLLGDCTGAADPDVDFTLFRGIVVQFSSDIGGYGSVYGNAALPVTIDGATGLYGIMWLGVPVGGPTIHSLGVTAHEMGHSLGFSHSKPNGFTPPAYIANKWDVMSDPSVGNGMGQHTISHNKDLAGWLPSNRVFVAPSGASQTVIALERSALPAPGTSYLMAMIPIPGSSTREFYSVESRMRVGWDLVIPADGVLIWRVNMFGGDQAALVDADGNNNPNDAGAVWVPGETFTDPASGISIAVESATGTGHQVRVSTGNVPLTRTLTLTVVGPGEVTSSIGGAVRCDTTCTFRYVDGTAVSFYANPIPAIAAAAAAHDCSALGAGPDCVMPMPFDPSSAVSLGAAFAGWGGDCAFWDSSPTCTMTMSTNRTVTATFVPGYKAELRLTGLGGVFAFTAPHPAPGALFGCDANNPTPGSVACARGSGWMPRDSIIDFFQYPAAGWGYGPWGGDCTGAAVISVVHCRLVASGNRIVEVSFTNGRTLSVSPKARRDSIGVGSASRPDSAAVTTTGTPASWVAAAKHPWLQVTNGSGTASSMLRWLRNPAGLGIGRYIGLIEVRVTGASGSPAFLVDTLDVLPALRLTMQRTSAKDSTAVGSTSLRVDSSLVSFSGIAASTAPWTATHGSAPWLALEKASGLGPGFLRWSRNPANLAVGTHVDTITVVAVGAQGSPMRIVDTLLVLNTFTARLATTSRRDSIPQGTLSPFTASSELTLTGLGSATAGWTATHGSRSWLIVSTTAGVGTGIVRWEVNPVGLTPGVHVDTITVTVAGASGSPLRFQQNLVIFEPEVAVTCAASALINGDSCLASTERNYLDITGNKDGTYNLGDLLSFLDRKGSSATALLRLMTSSTGASTGRQQSGPANARRKP